MHYIRLITFTFICITFCAENGFAREKTPGNSLQNDSLKFHELYTYIGKNFFSKTAELNDQGKEAIRLGIKIKDSAKTADVYRMMGVYHFFNGDYNHALSELLQALRISDQLNDPLGKSRTYHELGTLYMKNLKRSEAISIFDSCLKYARISKDPASLATAYNNFGIVAEYNKEYKKSFQYYDTAYKHILQKPDSLSLSYSFENLGAIYLLQHQYDSSEKYLMLSRKYREGLKLEQPTAYSYLYLGDLYHQKKEYQQAIKMYQKCVDICLKISYPDLLQRTYSKLSETYKEIKDYKNAYEYFYKAESYKDSIFNSEKLSQIAEMKTRFEVENKEKQYQILMKNNQLVTQQERNKNLIIWFISVLSLLLFSGIAIYIYRNRQIQRIKTQAEILDAEARQRLRISQDLHDNVGSQLSFVVSNLEMTEKKIRTDNEVDLKRMKAISEMSKQAIHTLRETVWALNNQEIPLESFYDKFKDFALKLNEFNEHISLEFEEDIGHNHIIKPNAALNLFRICQEIFSNAVKHSAATKIGVSLISDSYSFEFQIKDNGIGFDGTQKKAGHYGLSNIENRAKELGADYKIESKKGEGTQVRISLVFDKNTSDVVCV